MQIAIRERIVRELGLCNLSFGAAAFGLQEVGRLCRNFEAPQLYEEALKRGEASIAKGGSLVAGTGLHTGLAPEDKFIVRDALTEGAIWWENCAALSPGHFSTLHSDMLHYAFGKTLFAQDLYMGADANYRLSVKVFTEYAWHSLFIKILLIQPGTRELADFVPDLTVFHLPNFAADPERHGCRSKTVIAIDLSRKTILIGGTSYAGELKKAIFTYFNFFVPGNGVLPMHCAVNAGSGGDTALFFGLSGTGKTALTADSCRVLVGDDEHGWSPSGVFNLEGGCYAKALDLSNDDEPEIVRASERFGTVMENVVLYPFSRAADFEDRTVTENTRITYPLDFIEHASVSRCASHPKNLIMLTCDAFGVLPPIAKLDHDQALYHFISGYTAKVAGTEDGICEPKAAFSACFGAPFMPRHPLEYGDLFRELIDRHKVDCWLVNTGWTGGAFGTGRRMPIKVTRALLAAALDGSLNHADFRADPYFGIAVPTSVPGVEPHFLNPARAWKSQSDYTAAARKLVEMFRRNFARFEDYVGAQVKNAQPCIQIAAE